VPVTTTTANVAAVRSAQGPAPVIERPGAPMAPTSSSATAQPAACTARSSGPTCQLWPLCAWIHKAMPTKAPSTQGAHNRSERSARASGSVSNAHSANSDQGSAPVW
jgi:hypothetical protein